jgi:rSAM/selenodomain-associated transferase 1
VYAHPDTVIMVFCKAPIPGQVKTRLTPPLTEEEAAQLHCELTEKTLQTATQKRLCEVQLWCSPSIDHPFFGMLAQKYTVDLYLQRGENLGQRMHHAMVCALSHFNHAVIIGCDCPALIGDDLGQAISQLKAGKECVIIPTEDGGYVLIGLNQPQPSLFDAMSWGTDKVLQLTHARLQALSIEYMDLETRWDLDTADDLKRYQALSTTTQKS